MNHYFKDSSNLEHKEAYFEFEIDKIRLKMHTDRGVFSLKNIDYGTRFLLEHVTLNDDHKVVFDMGSGYGPIGLYLAKKYQDKQFYLYDINPRAVSLAEKNKHENNITNASIEHANLFEKATQKADVIITNPPIRAGKQVVFKLYEQAYACLKDNGVFICVIQKKQGAPSTLNKLKSMFSEVTKSAQSKGYWLISAKKAK
jgi:16S rRNA (guanine1207-N2)-methyltransferase